jgi:hypothetical protein
MPNEHPEPGFLLMFLGTIIVLGIPLILFILFINFALN